MNPLVIALAALSAGCGAGLVWLLNGLCVASETAADLFAACARAGARE